MNFKNIDTSKIAIGKLEESKKQKGFKSCIPTYDGKTLTVQFPNANFSFGASPPNADVGAVKWTLPIARDFNGKPFSQPMLELFGKIEEFDNWLAQYAFDHPIDFFGAPKKLEVIKEFQNKSIKFDKKVENAEKYGPRLAPTLPYNDGHFIDIKCKDVDGSDFPVENILRKSQGIVIVELASIYSVGGKAFGATWNVRSIQITKHASNEAPPIDVNMYNDVAFEQALLDVHIPEPSSSPKREREEEEEPVVEEAPQQQQKKGKRK